MSMEIREIAIKIIILLICTLLVIAIVIGFTWDYIGNEIILHEGRFRYSIESEESRWSVDVLDIITEKGKEPVYVLGINGSIVNKRELSESQYFKYIGADCNAITVKKSTLNLWLSKNPFTDDLNHAWRYEAQRIQYPWSEPLTEFTDDDAKELVDAFISDGVDDIELPFVCDSWTELRSIGLSAEKENSKSFD